MTRQRCATRADRGQDRAGTQTRCADVEPPRGHSRTRSEDQEELLDQAERKGLTIDRLRTVVRTRREEPAAAIAAPGDRPRPTPRLAREAAAVRDAVAALAKVARAQRIVATWVDGSEVEVRVDDRIQ